MNPPVQEETVIVAIPRGAYGLIVDFCMTNLGCEEMPNEETLGLVVAQLLAAGICALEAEDDERDPASLHNESAS